MDCNREEAIKAKETAERKFNAKDIKGAKKLALKAQNLFPSLEGISQMVSTLDVYIAAEKKINGENDWYEILSVSASADEEELKKHYKKLALQLHPDKNKSVGAEGAFKLISEAWSVLSDEKRKMAFDQMRSANVFQNKTSQQHTDNLVHNSGNGFYSFSKTTRSSKRARKSSNTSAASVPQPHSINLNTFWTSCNRCRMQYEYLRIYLNHNLLCPNCHQAFLATEIGIPGNAANSSIPWSAKQNQQNLNHNYTVKNGYNSGFNTNTFPGTGQTDFQHGGNFDSYNHQNFQWSSFSGSAGAKDSAFQSANLNHKKLEKLRRKHEKAQAAARREESFRLDDHVYKNSFNGSGNYNSGHTISNHAPERPISKVGRPPKRTNVDQVNIYYGIDKTENLSVITEKTVNMDAQRPNGAAVDFPRARMTARQSNMVKEFSHFNIREMLIEKTKATICKKLKEWNIAQEIQLDEREKSLQKNQQEVARDWEPGEETHLDECSMKDSTSEYDANLDKKILRPVSIDVLVPDPDFYDFDKDRLERTFKCDQVWATYDSEDGMPRLYAMVKKVLSLKPFRIRMSFLTSKSNSELGPINWVACGYAKTCGDFRVGRYQISDTVNIFSHRVRWEKGPRGVIRIVPRKGDIWALYRNWSPDWNELTPNDVIYKYEMVEVLDDYQEEHGVSVIPLVKVAGFKAVFHRHMDQTEVKRITREEMFRFSHKVPSYLLTGEEAHNALKGCLELDPAATPVELLQVITEVKEDVGMEINGQESSN
ncbi:hypothetical protein Cni_G11193 [Canna indica]|uniref:J domain-containing protein n=1 Tax=Canna indica TaxID=4628 RepID=A0AAQ3Q9A3_9LILI|nr:hypothetical protein Cni_G11193 [Canna indica]